MSTKMSPQTNVSRVNGTAVTQDTDSRGEPLLPVPPRANYSRQESAKCRQALAEYYWVRHFETGLIDPASFIDRLMTDYARYDSGLVDEWLEDMSTPYQIYRTCLQHGVKYGRPDKAALAKSFQGVICLSHAVLNR